MRIALLCTMAMIVSSCGNNSNDPADEPAPEEIDTAGMACSDILRSGTALDFRQGVHVPDVDQPVETVTTAFTEVETFLGEIGCDAGSVSIDENMGSACSDIEGTGFRVCLVATNEGQFFVHEMYPDLVSVTWNRWD